MCRAANIWIIKLTRAHVLPSQRVFGKAVAELSIFPGNKRRGKIGHSKNQAEQTQPRGRNFHVFKTPAKR